MISFEAILYSIALAALGAGAGFGLGLALFQDGPWKPRDYHGNYLGGLPILGGVCALLLVPSLPLTQEIWALVGVTAGYVFLGMFRDFRKTPLNVLLPYQILLVIVGAFYGIEVPHRIRILSVFLTIAWPMVILYCLKLASLVIEMPFLLALGSGVTFLLFFPNQISTPPWMVVLTLGLIVIAAHGLILLLRGKKGLMGDSGLFALSYLLSAISMLGRSKSLLMFGLLVPTMVIVYPFLLICLLLISPYLGNELYNLEARERKPTFRWNLSRRRLVFFSALVFFCLNFLELFIFVKVPWYGYLALVVLFAASVFSFVRTFASRSSVQPPEMGSRIQILGIPVDVCTPATVLEKISGFIREPDGFFHIVTADSLAIFRANRDKGFGRILHRASMILPDGAGLVWAADFLGTPIPGRTPGIALVSDLCGRAAKEGWSIYFLGSKPGVMQEAVDILLKRFPTLNVAGVHHGYFHEGSEVEEQVLEDLRQKKPDVAFIALGVPKQELFIQRLRPIISKTVAIGVGGSFDVISGNLPRAPVLMQKFALEWLFRLWKEPRRLIRILRIPWFVLAVIRAKWQDEEFVV